MNRRSFITNLIGATAAFSILPGAVTYTRKWKQVKDSRLWVINPDWINAPYEIAYLDNHIGDFAFLLKSRDSFVPTPGTLPPLRFTFDTSTGYLQVPPFIPQP